MGRLTTHVLDTANGRPGRGIAVRLYAVAADGSIVLVAEARTNDDGRCDKPLLEGAGVKPGKYRLDFSIGDYFRAQGAALAEPAFLDVVSVAFGLADESAHYHVPLLVSPYGYTTYRGS